MVRDYVARALHAGRASARDARTATYAARQRARRLEGAGPRGLAGRADRARRVQRRRRRAGARLRRSTVRVFVSLGELTPDDVDVAGRARPGATTTTSCVDPTGRLVWRTPRPTRAAGTGSRATSSSTSTGPFGYTVRILPQHELLASVAELGLVACRRRGRSTSDGAGQRPSAPIERARRASDAVGAQPASDGSPPARRSPVRRRGRARRSVLSTSTVAVGPGARRQRDVDRLGAGVQPDQERRVVHAARPRRRADRSWSPARNMPERAQAAVEPVARRSSPRRRRWNQVMSLRAAAVDRRPVEEVPLPQRRVLARAAPAAAACSVVRGRASASLEPASRPRRSRCRGRRRCCCRCWVRPRSSPAVSIGTPVESSSVASRFADCRRRSASTSASSVSPSTPQFQRPVVVGAVAVVLAVGLVVLVVVGDQVAQGEAVVGGHEVDRRERQPAVVGVQVARPGQPGGQVAHAAAWPRQKSRTVSRYLSFHSHHGGGKLPTW